MQETVRNTNEMKSLFSTYLEVLEGCERQALAERQLHDERFLRRTQRIYDLHERQRREALEVRRCLDYVSQHAHMLETALRGAAGASGGEGGGGEGVPLSAALVRQASALQRCMAQCVDNATKIRQLLTPSRRLQMDTMLSKMESELRTWNQFVQRAADCSGRTETLVDNLHNMIAEQRRCVREVSASSALTSLCGGEGEGGEGVEGDTCSTPIARD